MWSLGWQGFNVGSSVAGFECGVYGGSIVITLPAEPQQPVNGCPNGNSMCLRYLALFEVALFDGTQVLQQQSPSIHPGGPPWCSGTSVPDSSGDQEPLAPPQPQQAHPESRAFSRYCQQQLGGGTTGEHVGAGACTHQS